MKRDADMRLVMTQTEKAALVKLAEVEGGLSQAAVVRRLIRAAARERGVWPLPAAGSTPSAADRVRGAVMP
jgi:hypothetical protein